MSSVVQLPSLLHTLLHILLFSLDFARGAVIKPPQVKAIAPACTTLANGLTTCNVGVNTVPPLVSLDGGYQWLTVEPTTMTLAGSAVSTNEAVWTAIQTSYLDIVTVTTTGANGVTSTLASTEYVSFVTTTTGSAAAPTAIIVAAVIAPAAIAYLQPIVDAAGGKTVAALGAEILSELAKANIFLTKYEAEQLGAAIIAAGTTVGVVGTANYLYLSFRLSSYIPNINIKPNPPTETTTSTTSSATPDVTAIVDLPYPDYQDFQVPMIASGPTPTSDDFAPTDVPAGGQQIALASYINPLGDPASWQRIFTYDSSKVSVLVANVLNGPDYVVSADWKSVIDQAAGQGKTIIGYVRTGYLGVSQQQFTTRLGSHNLADWASQIEQDVDKWFELYGTSLGGIFFDEGWPEYGPNNIYADLYASINNYTKRKHPGAYTVLNPGSPIAQCFENTMDTLLTFESSYETYTSSYVPNDWIPTDPRKIWHIIFRVPQDQVAIVAALAWSRHAGLLEVTDDDQPNPYDTLPNEAYMQAAIGAIAGGKPRIDDPAESTGSHVAGLPSDSAVSSSDYSSVTLTWSSVENALGYAVYKFGVQVLELPASMTRATIGMLDPGTADITFEVQTILASSSGGNARLIFASTKSLPSSGTMTNIGFTQNGDTVVYTADVLIPYAFVRLFIGINQPSPGIGRGWPIDEPKPDVVGTVHHEIVNYLVEGNDFYSGFYKYSGAWYETSKANADWSWSPLGTAPQTQNGYTYTWTVPFAGTDAVASEYVIQGQGYAPVKNVFKGTLRLYSY